jgi:hypothetical protein
MWASVGGGADTEVTPITLAMASEAPADIDIADDHVSEMPPTVGLVRGTGVEPVHPLAGSGGF